MQKKTWQTDKTLPEAQRTQGIEFITQIIFMTEINLISSYLKEKKGISDSNIFNQSHSKCITDSKHRKNYNSCPLSHLIVG